MTRKALSTKYEILNKSKNPNPKGEGRGFRV
jgi:hypothetical protein